MNAGESFEQSYLWDQDQQKLDEEKKGDRRISMAGPNPNKNRMRRGSNLHNRVGSSGGTSESNSDGYGMTFTDKNK